jgi:hypothetical protein
MAKYGMQPGIWGAIKQNMGFADGGLVSGLFRGVPRDRAAQIDAAVNGAVAPTPATVPASEPVDEEDTPEARMRALMRDIRTNYADGGQVGREAALYQALRGRMSDSEKVLSDAGAGRLPEMRGPRSEGLYKAGELASMAAPRIGGAVEKMASGMQLEPRDYGRAAAEALFYTPLGAIPAAVRAAKIGGQVAVPKDDTGIVISQGDVPIKDVLDKAFGAGMQLMNARGPANTPAMWHDYGEHLEAKDIPLGSALWDAATNYGRFDYSLPR